ncbi:MAG: PEP-CTERM sorting domain-containing protein [Candidatus Competibacter sp.]|nr:PEP-CTERM sorting domain-containing protein [Candidatus Competibacter sp.]
MFNHTNKKMIWSALLACIGWGTAAHAVEIKFDFNSLADRASNLSVQTYLQTMVGSLGSVTVTGAKAEKDYTGDGYVVGPTIANKATPETLGTSDGDTGRHTGVYNSSGNFVLANADTFLVNSGSDRITITFSFPIYAASFDYEIFPDGTCPYAGSSNCLDNQSSNWPDFTFKADNNLLFRTLSTVPSGAVTHSPHSGLSSNETAPQYLGVSGLYTFNNGVKKLEFIDWPRMIGIDNLVIRTDIPEPATVLLTGIGLTGLGLARRRTKKM